MRRFLLVTSLTAASVLVADTAVAGAVWLPGAGAPNTAVPVKSLHERRFQNIVRQQYDFSCGSAALATLLTFHYERPTSEKQAFDEMYARGDQEKIRLEGFSLLDMKNYLESIGYRADGYHASLATLASTGVPAIALISVNGYRHFVVVKGLENGEVLVGDPATGMRRIRHARFRELWVNGILFIIRNEVTIAKRHFNADQEWKLLARAPLGTAVSHQTLEDLSIHLPRLNDYPL